MINVVPREVFERTKSFIPFHDCFITFHRIHFFSFILHFADFPPYEPVRLPLLDLKPPAGDPDHLEAARWRHCYPAAVSEGKVPWANKGSPRATPLDCDWSRRRRGISHPPFLLIRPRKKVSRDTNVVNAYLNFSASP